MKHNLVLTERQEKLFSFVKEQHGDQPRKYTNEPYWHHLVEVAELVQNIPDPIFLSGEEFPPLYIEIALCHDILEDTKCDYTALRQALSDIGYSSTKDSFIIGQGVEHLTDKYTKEDYPGLNRRERKYNEVRRLSKIPYWAQTVKYADMISNTTSIVAFDSDFSKVYIPEIKKNLDVTRNGDLNLLIACCNAIYVAEQTIRRRDYKQIVAYNKLQIQQ